MRTITENVNLYSFDELDETVKNKVLQQHIEWNTQEEWYDLTECAWIERLEEIGFENAEIAFSGFGSQEDGASFTANINMAVLFNHLLYCKNAYDDSLSIEIMSLVGDLFHDCTIERGQGLYVHERTTYFDIGFIPKTKIATSWLEQEVMEIVIKLNKSIFSDFGEEYLYITSEDYIKESLIDVEFRANGERWEA